MFVNIMYNMRACDAIFRKLSERMAKIYLKVCLLFNYMLHVLHKLPYDRRRKAYRLSQMIKRSFQHTALASCQFAVVQRCPVSHALYRNLKLHPTTTLFPKVSRGPIVAPSPLLDWIKTHHISKFSWSWVKQKINKVQQKPICSKLKFISWSRSYAWKGSSLTNRSCYRHF